MSCDWTNYNICTTIIASETHIAKYTKNKSKKKKNFKFSTMGFYGDQKKEVRFSVHLLFID